MLLAYLDESVRKKTHYYMGAIVVDAEMCRVIDNSLDGIGDFIAQRVPGFDPRTEFHGYEIFQGRDGWKDVPVDLRVRACKAALRRIADSGARFVMHGIDIPKHRRKYRNPYDPHQLALCHTLETVQDMAPRIRHAPQDILAIADEHHAAMDSRTRFVGLKQASLPGYTTTPLTNFLDSIYFGPSHHSRLLQAADMTTFFSTRQRHEEEGDPRAEKAMTAIGGQLGRMRPRTYLWPK